MNKMQQNILLKSLKSSFSAIKSHILLSFILLILEIGFVVSLGIVIVPSSVNIMVNAQDILNYAESLNLDESSLGSNLKEMPNALGDDPLFIYRKFKEMISQIIFTLIVSSAIILVFSTINWSLTHQLFEKFDAKEFFRKLWKSFLANLLFIGISILFIIVFFQQFYLDLVEKAGFFIGLAIFVLALIFYFMIVCLGLVHLKLSGMIKGLFSVGTKKAYYLVPAFILNILVMSGFWLLSYVLQEKNYFLLMGMIILSFVWIVLSRVFWIGMCRELPQN